MGGGKGKGHPLVSYQPFKLLFQLTYTATIILRVPYYAAISLIPSLRANRNWSAKQNFMTRISNPMLDIVARIGITDPLTLNPGKEGERFQSVPASSLNFYKGPLVSDSVKPAKIGGTWYPELPGKQIVSKSIVLYLHGGAFVQGDGRIENCGQIAKYFLDKGAADAVFTLQYRLSGHGRMNPFPAALQDALSGYLFLINELKVPAKNITLAGDSAGANLAMGLVRYLAEFGSSIKAAEPKCAVLLSPWVDPMYRGTEKNDLIGVDFIPLTYGLWGSNAYTDGCSEPRANPYITPLGHPISTAVPLFINVGTSELGVGAITHWAEEMRGVEGNKVVLHHEKDAVHDTYLIGLLMGFEESAWIVAGRVAEFVKGL